ncbi:MAG: hypothetical protein AAFN08_04430 [Cyanobacteria bacterium J06559_3]
MTAIAPVIVQSLQNALSAYIKNYGGGESLQDVRAIAGALLAVKAKAQVLLLQGLEIEAWVDAVVRDFDLRQLTNRIANATEQALATQAKLWREKVELKVRATLDAYIQTYVPDLDTHQIQATIATILPIVEDAQVSRDEAKRIIHHISNQYDWRSPMRRIIDPKWVILAGKAWKAFRNRDIEATVQDVVQVYISKFKPALVEMGEGLAEQALTALFNSKAQLDLDLDLDPESQRLIVQQVSFKMKLMEASPPPSKTVFEIAQQTHDAILHYRTQQRLGTVSLFPPVIHTDETNTAMSSLGGEMSIGIEIQPSATSQPEPGEGGETPKIEHS